MLFKSVIPAGLLLALELAAAPIRQDQPARTNFNATHNWTTASAGKAAGPDSEPADSGPALF